jgi:hypothetical protein
MDMKMIVAVAVGICATREDSWQNLVLIAALCTVRIVCIITIIINNIVAFTPVK